MLSPIYCAPNSTIKYSILNNNQNTGQIYPHSDYSAQAVQKIHFFCFFVAVTMCFQHSGKRAKLKLWLLTQCVVIQQTSVEYQLR